MAKLTGTRHGDPANELLAFYQEKVHELEEPGQYLFRVRDGPRYPTYIGDDP